MSYDLHIWSVGPCDDAPSHTVDGGDWLLNVSENMEAMAEDMPVEAFESLEGEIYDLVKLNP